MDDLISRQAAIDAMCSACGHDCDKSKFVYNAPQDEEVIMCPEHYALSTLPPAQPEIIRCGDCKWFQCNMRMDGYLPNGVDEFECRHWCGSCDPVDFCSHAERRSNDY